MTFHSYRYRIYPNKSQKIYFSKVFGCVRFVYNKMLEDSEKYYEIEGKRLGTNPSSYKKDFPFLKEVDSSALSNAKMNLDRAYTNFFKGICKRPKFKSKKDNYHSYTTNYLSNNIRIEGNHIRLPKVKFVKIRLHRELKGEIRSVTVSLNPSGQYHVSILVKTTFESLPKSDKKIGIDMGVTNLVTCSDGTKIQNPKITNKYAKKLAREQRRLARKAKDSKNRQKQRVKLANVYRKIAAVRKDNLHKISRRIVDENQVIACEDLVIKDILKNNDFAIDIEDSSWSKLIGMIKYKSEIYGRDFVQVDRYYPSSQKCSCCGFLNSDIKNISVKHWRCPECSAEHDRDINAAKNILAEGLHILINKLGSECPEVTPLEIGMSVDESGSSRNDSPRDLVIKPDFCSQKDMIFTKNTCGAEHLSTMSSENLGQTLSEVTPLEIRNDQ